ncbi:MAG: hypothetical protein SFW66_02905 [Gammaproteobacteria bacterium]|nr:hypothetical protein [Gammaproteobacteria bacterium]
MHSSRADYFNPHVYETTSAILPLLAENNWELSTPIDLAKKTGFFILEYKDVFENKIQSNLSFYSLMECYESLNHYYYFYAHLIQKKPMGVLDKNCLSLLADKLQAVIQIYYLALLMGKYIHPNLTLIESLSHPERTHIFKAINIHLSYEKLIAKIINEKINIEAIYKDPTPAALSVIENLLMLPKEIVSKVDSLFKPKPVSLPATHIFTQIMTNYQYNLGLYNPYLAFSSMLSNENHYKIHHLLQKFAVGDIGYHFFAPVEAQIHSIANRVHQAVQHLRKVVGDIGVHDKVDSDSIYITHPFPLVLAYRPRVRFSLTPRLGIDIRLLATDSEENIHRLGKFLSDYYLDDIEIISIAELQRYKQNKSRIPSEEKTDSILVDQSLLAKKTVEANLSVKIYHTNSNVMVWFGYSLPSTDIEFIDGNKEFIYGKNTQREVREYLFSILEDIQMKAADREIIFQSCSIDTGKLKQYPSIKLDQARRRFEEVVSQYQQDHTSCLLQ